MPSTIHVHFLPSLVPPDALAGGTVVVIDVLRATTTIVHALAAGATQVIPCLEIDDARRIAAGLPPGTAVLGGERKGGKIEGFDLGNSPSEYLPESVGGRAVIFTTTNGTRAMQQCRQAARVLIGAFVNLDAVLKQLAGQGAVHLLCAGTDGQVTREDVLCAGALVTGLVQHPTGAISQLNDSARLARDLWTASLQEKKSLADQLAQSHGGENLIGIGLERDILAAAQISSLSVVPQLDLQAWRITAR